MTTNDASALENDSKGLLLSGRRICLFCLTFFDFYDIICIRFSGALTCYAPMGAVSGASITDAPHFSGRAAHACSRARMPSCASNNR